jgi:ADP-heptose:LPS heptosyltransferase
MPSKRAKATEISTALGEHCIDLTGRADQLEAFAIVGRARFVLSEDSGLMHMAWTQGTPTLALFSDSRRDWSAPQGSWSDCLDSSDLPCGPCGLPVCKFGDNRCLTRYPAAPGPRTRGEARLRAHRAWMRLAQALSFLFYGAGRHRLRRLVLGR